MKIWIILTLFVTGALVVVAGAAFKLMHWPGSTAMLASGLCIQALSGVLVIIKLIKEKK